MLRWTLLSTCCLLCASSTTLADIYVWEGDPNDCTISDINNTIQINEAGTYGFRAERDSQLAEIQWIKVQSGVTGTVTVKIAYDATGGDGATDVWEIDLSNAGTGNIAELDISGHLATVEDVVCDNVTGDIYIAGDLGKIGLPHTKLSADTVTGAITIAGKIIADDMLEANTLGDLTVYGSGVTPVQGDIHVTNS